MKGKPNPGSVEAEGQGCTCAVIDNHYGRGFLWPGSKKLCFWVSEDCPLHAELKP